MTLGPEGIRLFRTVAPTGTPAWSLWLNGDPRDLTVRKNFVPFHTSATYYDRKQSGQMLVVPTYLGTGAATYFASVTGNPGDAVNLDSRIQEVSDIGFNTTVSNVAVTAAPYRVYRVQVPVEQIAWDVSTVANSGNPNVCVRRDNVPAEFDNDAYSEAPGSATDSVTLVPTALADGAFFITVYDTGSYNFTLFNGSPTITPLAYTDTKINDQPARAGWRFYALTDIPAQVGTLVWELLLSNQVPGTQIAVRRNKVPGRWQYRTNGTATVNDTNSTYFDFSGGNGFLQRPRHQADVWYVGVYLSEAPLGTFTLDVHPIVPGSVGFDGATAGIGGLEPGKWKFVRVDVPATAGVLGWDVRVRDVSGGTPQVVVRRDQLPLSVALSAFPPGYNDWSPQRQSGWASGYQWTEYNDWTQRYYDAGSNVLLYYRRMVMGMGRPLEPGTYYVGVYNPHATESTTYTLDSRGIGAGQTFPITDLAYAGGSAAISNLAPREAMYFKVTIPANTSSWELTLDPTVGEMMMAVRRGTVPDFSLTRDASYYGWFSSYTTPQADFYSREVPVQKSEPERYTLLPPDGQDYLVAGDYYIAGIGEGQNPADAQHTGTGNSSGVLTSLGALSVTNFGPASLAGTTQPVSLGSGQVKAYQFTVPAGTASLEVRLENRAGNPRLSLAGGSRIPQAYTDGSYSGIYGIGDGQSSTVNGVTWQQDDDLITIANPPAGTYSLLVRATYDNTGPPTYTTIFPSASANLVVRQKPRYPLNFGVSENGNGQSHTDTRQAIDSERNFYQVAVPTTLAGQPVVGWVLKVNHAQGDTTLRFYKTWGNTDNTGITVTGNVAVVVPPFLTPGDTWYVEVQATGLTNYTLTSQPIILERPVWMMPVGHNTTFGDSGNDANGLPLPGDRGVDIGEDDWHFYAIDIPEGNSGLLRTELQAINGNPNLYLREDGVPTTDHDGNGGTNLNDGVKLAPRSLTATASEYGNWVPLDGLFERHLLSGRWYLGVKATGGTNARYRLIVSNGQVTDVPLSGGAANNQTLVGRDWRYYRFTIPADAPNNWNLTFSQQVGDVVMWLRDTIPPGNNADGLETSDLGRYWYFYGAGLRTWNYDGKNQGPYDGLGHDAAGTYTFNTPSLRPGSTYYVGFKANNDATFSLSSATSGGTIGVLPSLDFYTGTVTTSIPASGSVLYQIPVPPEATRFKYSSTHASSVTVRLEQGTLPGTTGTQHLISSGANSSLNQQLSTAVWPWQPNQTYYVRFVNTAATSQAITFTLNGKNALTEDEDNDRLPDQWELQYFGTTAYTPAQDNDKDGANHLAEWAFNLNPTRPDIAALTPGTGTAGLPVARLTGSAGNQRLTIEFIRRKNVALTYTVQFANSPAGASFVSAVNAPTVTPIDANWERVVVEDNVTTGDQALRFGRVRVTAP